MKIPHLLSKPHIHRENSRWVVAFFVPKGGLLERREYVEKAIGCVLRCEEWNEKEKEIVVKGVDEVALL